MRRVQVKKKNRLKDKFSGDLVFLILCEMRDGSIQTFPAILLFPHLDWFMLSRLKAQILS